MCVELLEEHVLVHLLATVFSGGGAPAPTFLMYVASTIWKCSSESRCICAKGVSQEMPMLDSRTVIVSVAGRSTEALNPIP